MTLTVLLPTTVAMPHATPDGTRYVPYDPYTPLPEEHLDAEVLGEAAIGWANGPDRCAVPSARPDRRSPRPRPCRRAGAADPVQRVERLDAGRPRRQRRTPVPADAAGQAAGLVG